MKLEVDKKRSKNGKSVPRKVFVNGVKARKFLSFSAQNDNSARTTNHTIARMVNFNRWKVVHNAVVDHANNS